MSPMLSYHNDPAIKAKYLERVRMHREAAEYKWLGDVLCEEMARAGETRHE